MTGGYGGYDHSAPDCPCPWCSSERLTYCLLTREAKHHLDHLVVGCPSRVIPPAEAYGFDSRA